MKTASQRKGGSFLTRIFPAPRYLKMPAIGVDISDRSVKYASFVERNGAHRLRRFGEHTIPEGVIAKGKIVQPDALGDVLRALRREVRTDIIRASLPEEHAYIFQTTIPTETQEQEIRTMLEFQLEEHVPVPVRDAVFDYEFLLPLPGHTHREVTVSVYSKTIVAGYIDSFVKAGFTPLSLEVEARAVARATIPEGDAGTYMLVDFGSLRTGIAIFSRGSVCFTSTVAIGGEPLSTTIRDTLKVSDAEVEKIKNEQGLRVKDNPELALSMQGAISSLRDEISKHLNYWHTHMDAVGTAMPPVEKKILCGGSSNLAGLSEYLSANLRITTTVGNVWTNAFSFDDVIPELDHAHSLGFAATFGLALRT